MTMTRPAGVRSLVAAAALGLLACGAVVTGAAPIAVAPEPVSDEIIVHVLDRTGFGARPGDVDRVRAMGLQAYLEEQLDPDRAGVPTPDAQLRELRTLTLSTADLLREYPRPDPAARTQGAGGEAMPPEARRAPAPRERRPVRMVAELQAARLVRAVRSERQLEEVMVDFWLNHFNVSVQKGAVRWYVTSFERDVIRPHAFGRFRQLLLATARHPAMLFYLDNWVSARPGFVVPAGPNQGRTAGLNENYARELMELHTLGVDGGYTQRDVTEVARAFTGWSIERPYRDGRFVFRPAFHDQGVKIVLGQSISAGGERDGMQVIDQLARHPATAHFLATKLVRRFVSDDPPPALVERVAATYRDTDGDVRAMLRVVLTSPEFVAPEARRAKIKKPFELVASASRAVDAAVDARGGFELARASARIGEPLYQAQAPTGYADRAEAWVNAGALLARMNFALDLVHQRLPGVRVDVAPLLAGVDRRRPEAVLDQLLARVVPGRVSPETRATLEAQLRDPRVTRLTPDDRVEADTDVATVLALVLGSPEFQRR